MHKKILDKSETFVERAKLVHGDKYSYANTKYTGRHEKLTITCKVHGDFEIEAGSVLCGSGCIKCRNIATSERCKRGLDEFIVKSKLKFGDDLSFDKSRYVTCKDKLTITCKIHGDFVQSPDVHLSSSFGCPKCAIDYNTKLLTKSHDDFKGQIDSLYPNKFVFLSRYEQAARKLKTKCVSCDYTWLATPTHLLRGKGCPKCAKYGFQIARDSVLYLYDLGWCIGFGITNNLHSRNKQHQLTFKRSGVCAELIGYYSGRGEDVLKIETSIKRHPELKSVDARLNGFRKEAVCKTNLDNLISFIESFGLLDRNRR